MRLGLQPGTLPGRVSVQGEPLVIDAPADVLAAQVADVVLRHAYESITTGRDAKTGGSKPDVLPRVADRPGRRSQFRGYATGQLGEDLERSPVQGTTGRARTTIQHPDAGRSVFLAAEAARGIHHTSVEGVARGKIEQAVRAFVEGAAGPEAEVVAAAEGAKRQLIPASVVKAIRAATGSAASVGRRFGVSASHVGRIRAGKARRDVT